MALTRKDCWDGRHMKFYEVFRKEVYNGDDSFVSNLEKFGVFDKLVKMTKCDGRKIL